jgi:hypothetical protein
MTSNLNFFGLFIHGIESIAIALSFKRLFFVAVASIACQNPGAAEDIGNKNKPFTFTMLCHWFIWFIQAH